MDFLQKEEKLLSSEAMEHERVSEKEKNKQMEGYEPNPKDHDLSEMFGLKNSFDNLSVGTDELGRLTIKAQGFKKKDVLRSFRGILYQSLLPRKRRFCLPNKKESPREQDTP